MFLFALLIGIYSYIIFFLGLIGILYPTVIVLLTLTFFISAVFIKRQNLRNAFSQSINFPKNKLLLIFSILFILQAVVNIIGALGPELAFDALWYHLTIPKLWLNANKIFYIPGGLLYYSAMPKLGEMFYIAALSFGSEITAKLIHFAFGLLTCLAIYKLSRKFSSPLISLLAVLIFYSNLVVAWESITPYVDLIRAFFEILALFAFINWWQTDKKKWLFVSALILGLAITTKLLAIGSLIIFSLLIVAYKKPFIKAVYYTIVYWIISLLIPLPWLIFSYLNTGNPFFPFFSETYKIAAEPLSPILFFSEIWNLFIHSADPVSPLYLIFLPLLIFTFPKLKKEIKIVTLYSCLSIIIWYFTPRTGGGRFILPYLPALSIVIAAAISTISENKRISKYFLNFMFLLIICTSLISTGYRFLANKKYIPAIIGIQSKREFLSQNLNFAYGDFYDTDGYFSKKITQKDNVLLIGFHNLYYVNFPFIDSSWVKKGKKFNYIATQKSDIPQNFKNWQLIYTNPKTFVKLYSQKGDEWDSWKY